MRLPFAKVIFELSLDRAFDYAVPEALAFKGKDPFYDAKMRVHLRRTSGCARLTIFEGGHGGNFQAGFDFLSRQRKGQPIDWSLPATGKGENEALSR